MQLFNISTFIVVVLLAAPAWAGELDGYNPQPVQNEQLRFIPTNISQVTIDMPVFPGASEVSSDILMQGTFGVDTQIFQAKSSYEKVVRFYQSRLGKQAIVINEEIVEGRRVKHFSLVSGSKSKNVIIEDVGNDTSRIIFTSFQGGGGFPTLAQ